MAIPKRMLGRTGVEVSILASPALPSTAVIGCVDLAQLEENVSFAQTFSAMGDEKRGSMVAAVARYARELMYYKP